MARDRSIDRERSVATTRVDALAITIGTFLAAYWGMLANAPLRWWVVVAVPLAIVAIGAVFTRRSARTAGCLVGPGLMAVGAFLLVTLFVALAMAVLLFGFLMSGDPG
jgi:hypothetical protein